MVPGSPALYYVPMLPLTVPAALAALSVGAALLSAYIVTRLNFPLFFEAGTGAAQLEVLLGRWALLNQARAGLVGAALLLLLLALVSATRSARTPSARDRVR